jgi:hypothetical protein
MDWNAAADAVIKLWREIGVWACGGLALAALLWKGLDAWGKRKEQ